MRKLIVFLFIFCTLYSLAKSQKTDTPIKLEYFTSIPKVIDGCSSTYTYDTTSLKKSQYIFISNIQDLGLIKVNGKTISLKMISNKQTSKATWKQVFKGSGYTITLTTKEIKQTGEEVTLEAGSLEVEYGTAKTIYKVHGESGC
ncbi:MAG TPA: hypothetical protein VNS32_22500 [Flavisolibacter sp.]|nr:hypothetical protein [Flavisolibacter sp.]